MSDLHSDTPTLKLSETQQEIFAGWKRPSEVFNIKSRNQEGPTMTTNAIMDLVQDLTTDCSVVASLCAVTARAERGHARVRTHHLQRVFMLIPISCFHQ